MNKVQIAPAAYYEMLQPLLEEFSNLGRNVVEGTLQIALDNGYTVQQAKDALSRMGEKFSFLQLLFYLNASENGTIDAAGLFRILRDYGVAATEKQVSSIFAIMQLDAMDLWAFETYTDELFSTVSR